MCTVTVLPTAQSVIITMNRDEARSRVEGKPEVSSIDGKLNCWHPVDNESGGTWMGVNNASIAAVLLNRYQEHNPSISRSRGELVPTVLSAKNLTELELLATRLDWSNYAPCDLIVFDQFRWINFCWDGKDCTILRNTYCAPFMKTSSSIDANKIRQFRLDKFDRFLSSQPSDANTVLNFHLTPCTHNPSMGVNMARPDRHTKSITQVQLSAGELQTRHFSESALTSKLNSKTWDITWPISLG